MKPPNKKLKKIKLLALYEIIVTAIVILFSFYSLIIYNFFPFNFFVAIIGLMGGILLLKKIKIGLYISIVWAILQTIGIQMGNTIINFSQLISLSIHFTLRDLNNLSDIAIYLNAVGAILLVLFLFWRKERFRQ